VGSALRTVHTLTKPQRRSRGGARRLPPQRRGAVPHERLLRREGNEGALGRGKARRVEDPSTAVRDFAGALLVPTVIRGSHPGLTDRPPLLAVPPEESLDFDRDRPDRPRGTPL